VMRPLWNEGCLYNATCLPPPLPQTDLEVVLVLEGRERERERDHMGHTHIAKPHSSTYQTASHVLTTLTSILPGFVVVV